MFAGRVRDRIASHFGKDSVFIDIDSIPFGKDFRVHIQEALARADAVLVVIGPRWLGVSKGSHSRIKEDTDPVRIEVETALSKGIPTIPILVGQTKMPKAEQLPESLRSFVFINAAPVDTGRDFHRDLNRVIGTVNSILEPSAGTAHMEIPLIPQMSETHHISDTNYVENHSAPEFALTQSPNLTHKKESNAELKQQTLIPKRLWLIALLTLGIVTTALVFFLVITRVQNSPGSPSFTARSPSDPKVTSTPTAKAAAAPISCSQEKKACGHLVPTFRQALHSQTTGKRLCGYIG